MNYIISSNKNFTKDPFLNTKKRGQETYFIENLGSHLSVLEKSYVCPIEKTVFFNRISLDLSHQPKIFLIFYALYKSKEEGMTRDELIQKVYAPSREEISERQRRCYRHNIIKLLSRARLIAHECFGSEHLLLEWFPYSSKIEKWHFCRPDIEHFSKLLGSDSHF